MVCDDGKPREIEADDILPGVEYPVTLGMPPSKQIQVNGIVSRVTRSTAELTISQAEWESLGWLDL